MNAKNIRKLTVVIMAVVLTMSIFSGSVLADSGWKCDSVGWWYETDGSYYKNEWVEIGGEWYHFNSRGYMEVNCYRGGYWLRSDGTWDRNFSHGTWKNNSKGWWYEDNGWYPKNTWIWIDGERYYFDSKGFMEHDCYRDGCWLKSNGSWDQKYRHGTWKCNEQADWFEDGGWYPRNQWLQINGIRYYFNNHGYYSGEFQISTDVKVYVSLDGMSSDEIVDNLKNLTRISKSDTFGTYKDRFNLGSGRIESNSDSKWVMYSSAKNYISSVYLYGVSGNKDGTTNIRANAEVRVSIKMDNYDRTVELYEKIAQNAKFYIDNRNETTWKAYAPTVHRTEFSSVSISKNTDDTFSLNVVCIVLTF